MEDSSNGNAEEPTSCWEYWNCSKEARGKCYVYQKDLGGFCWVLAPFVDKNAASPKAQHGFSSCEECPWYQKLRQITNQKDSE